jgi:hypothetical protein
VVTLPNPSAEARAAAIDVISPTTSERTTSPPGETRLAAARPRPPGPHGKRSYWRGEYLAKLSDEAIGTFTEYAPKLRAAAVPFSQAIISRIGQGANAVPDDATAFSHRDATYLFHPISMWEGPADDERL